jgi:hypothetical protein
MRPHIGITLEDCAGLGPELVDLVTSALAVSFAEV